MPICESCKLRNVAHMCTWDSSIDVPSVDAQSETNNSMTDENIRRIVQIVLEQIGDAQNTQENTNGLLGNAMPRLLSHYNDISCSWHNRQTENDSKSFFPQDAASIHDSNEFRRHLAALPDKSQCRLVFDYYLTYLEPIENILNRSLFLQEVKVFWYLNEETHRQAKDGCIQQSSWQATFWNDKSNWGFVALLFAVIQYCCTTIAKEKLEDFGLLQSNQDAAQLYDKVTDGFKFFYSHSNYLGEPTLWTIQSMCLTLFNLLPRLPSREALLWHANLVRLAQSMGLHRLGSLEQDLQCMSLRRQGNECAESHQKWRDNDLSFKHLESCALRPKLFGEDTFEAGNLALREIARKVFNAVLRMDWLGSVDHCFLIQLDDLTTSSPANLDDGQVLQLDTYYQKNPESIHAMLQNPNPTDATLISIARRICEVYRRQADMEKQQFRLTRSYELDPNSLKALHDEYANILLSLPAEFQLTGVAEYDDRVLLAHAKRPYLTDQRLFINECINFRIMKLFGPSFVRWLRLKENHDQAITCLRAATVVCRTHKELPQFTSPTHAFIYQRYQLLIAVIILHIAQSSDAGLVDHSQLRQEIVGTLKRLSQLNAARIDGNKVWEKPLAILMSVYFIDNNTQPDALWPGPSSVDELPSKSPTLVETLVEENNPPKLDPGSSVDSQDALLSWLSLMCTPEQPMDFSSIDSMLNL
ncbi:hypothetical protein MPSI1_003447 [Malassezia psittaci]|uniref:Xylanolytic transcriptional activator regulatory domain-containing protein n=1 Tax=Malassezia psittaci TaxID=1821823 RepID=A0AAF0JM44_9BASI|nr:hypothetical protein MPSI1_003447 [Malassezia psittaci]